MELSCKETKAMFAFSYHRNHTHTQTGGPLSRFFHTDIRNRLLLYLSLRPNKPVSWISILIKPFIKIIFYVISFPVNFYGLHK